MPSITWKDLYGDVHFEWTGSSCQIRYPRPDGSGQEVLDIKEVLIAHQMTHDAIRPSHLVRARSLVGSLSPRQEIRIPDLRLDVGRTTTGYVVAYEGIVSGPIAFLQDPADVTVLVGALTAKSDQMRLLFAARCTIAPYLFGFQNTDLEKIEIDWMGFLEDGDEPYRTFVQRHHVGAGLKTRRKGFDVAASAMTVYVRSWLASGTMFLPEPTVTPSRSVLN
jgi:hypothetical protein